MVLIDLLIFWAAAVSAEIRPLRIQSNLPLSGELATYGVAVREGVELAMSELGPEERALLQFEWDDNQSMPAQAVNVMQRHIRKPADIYQSGVRPQTMAIWDSISSARLPHFVWIFDRSIRATHKNTFRNYLSFKHEPKLIADYALSRKVSRFAIIYVQVPHTQEAYEDYLVRELKERGIQQLSIQPYDIGLKDFRSLVTRARAFKPDLLFLSGFQENLSALVKAAREQRLVKDGNVMTSYDLLDAAPLLGAELLEGVRLSTPEFLVSDPRKKYTVWQAKFFKHFQHQPSYTQAFAYDFVHILIDTRRRLGSAWSPARLFSAIQETDLQGITGPLKFDSEGDVPTPITVAVFRNGKLLRDSGLMP